MLSLIVAIAKNLGESPLLEVMDKNGRVLASAVCSMAGQHDGCVLLSPVFCNHVDDGFAHSARATDSNGRVIASGMTVGLFACDVKLKALSVKKGWPVQLVSARIPVTHKQSFYEKIALLIQQIPLGLSVLRYNIWNLAK